MKKKKIKSNLMDAMKVVNRMTPTDLEAFKALGWTIDDFSMELVYKGFPLVIEFCIGDFCTSICSKNNHWLLEEKVRNATFMDAINTIIAYQLRIDTGETWKGEDD